MVCVSESDEDFELSEVLGADNEELLEAKKTISPLHANWSKMSDTVLAVRAGS